MEPTPFKWSTLAIRESGAQEGGSFSEGQRHEECPLLTLLAAPDTPFPKDKNQAPWRIAPERSEPIRTVVA